MGLLTEPRIGSQSASAGKQALPVYEEFKIAHEYALKWFEVHAEQRLRLMRFYLLASGFSLAGFAGSLQANLTFMASIFGVLILSFSICFKLLDRRSSHLVKLAEEHLRFSGERMAEVLGTQTANLAKRAEENDGVPTYRQVFNVVFWVVGMTGLAAIIIPWVQAT